MAVLHITEAEAVRDIAALLLQVRNGTEVIIESGDEAIAILSAPEKQEPEPEGYDAWYRAEVQEALDSDPTNDLSSEQVEAQFAARREASQARVQALAQ